MKNSTIKLGKVVRIQSGYSPSSFTLTDSGPIPYVKVEDMNNCNKYQNESRFYTDDIKRSIPAGAVIFPKRGAAIMNNKVRIADRDICMDTNMMALIPDKKYLNSEYLLNLLIHEKLYKIADTSTIPQINNKHIDPYIIQLPSINKQKEIVQLMIQWDKTIEKIEALIDAKERQFGWLRLQLYKNASQNSKPIPLSKLVKFIDGYPFLSSGYSEDGVYNILTIANVQFGSMAHSFKGKLIRIPRNVRNEQILELGDILISMTGNVGRVCKVDAPNCLLNQRVGKLKANKNIASDFLYFSLLNKKFLRKMTTRAQGGAQGNLSKKDILKYQVTVPPFEEQNRIANTLNTAQEEINILKKLAEQYRTQKRGLMKKLLSGK